MKATAVFWIARAERLTKAHELLANNRNGVFGEWCEKEIGISRRTAERLIEAYGQYQLIATTCRNKTAEELPQSFYRKLAANDPQAEQIKRVQGSICQNPPKRPRIVFEGLLCLLNINICVTVKNRRRQGVGAV